MAGTITFDLISGLRRAEMLWPPLADVDLDGHTITSANLRTLPERGLCRHTEDHYLGPALHLHRGYYVAVEY